MSSETDWYEKTISKPRLDREYVFTGREVAEIIQKATSKSSLAALTGKYTVLQMALIGWFKGKNENEEG